MKDISFESVATEYCEVLKSLPNEYIKMISEDLKISNTKRVTELGCGNGLLTEALAERCEQIVGIDISPRMIYLAQSNEKGRAKYVCKDVFLYDYLNNKSDIIISYESIHLFAPLDELVEKCYLGLNNGGYICMGWCAYNWELPLKEIILDTYKRNGVEWGAWGFSKHYPFYTIINSHKGFSQVSEDVVTLPERWTPEEIVEYLLSISKSMDLSEDTKMHVKRELLSEINALGVDFNNETKFYIAYAKKMSEQK